MVMIALSLLLCTLTVHIYFRADRFQKVPLIFKIILLEKVARFYGILPKTEKDDFCEVEPVVKTTQTNDEKEKFVEKSFEIYREHMIRNSSNFHEHFLKHNLDLVNNNENNLNDNNDIRELSRLIKISKINRLRFYGIVPSDHFKINKINSKIYLDKRLTNSKNYKTNLLENSKNFYEKYYYTKQMSLFSELTALNRLEEIIKGINNELKDIKQKFLIQEEKNKLLTDWKLIALVLDRTFFFIFLVITLITLLVMLVNTILKL
jgi:hypothetical protein